MPRTMTAATTARGSVEGREKGWPAAHRLMAEARAAAVATGKTCRHKALSLTRKAWLLDGDIKGGGLRGLTFELTGPRRQAP
jgi:hypothetical protein